MKLCKRCNQNKPLEAFSKNKSKKDGLQVSCKECFKTINNNSYKNESGERRRKVGETRDRIKAINRSIISEHRSVNPCHFCGETEHCCLDFHHLDPTVKDKEISVLVHYSTARLVKEIAKCIVICSNCHRKHHAGIEGYEL
ncbi:hypothetical protein [Yersinia phage fHe-Yen9-03]|uniref:HNH endonuclease n=1 Tax=Yersinia phage fHe-Yen9-03 TaxID=2052743 RepID=A0A2C9CZ10_9CAUD|nr:hypothetical protein [Yersinia phage fHe-Yen9-03]